MANEKHYVFSARTTEKGLKALNQLKDKLGVGWDDLVVGAICGHYNLDKAIIGLPKTSRPKLTEVERKEHRNESSRKCREKKNAGKPKVEKAKAVKPKAKKATIKAKATKAKSGNGRKPEAVAVEQPKAEAIATE